MRHDAHIGVVGIHVGASPATLAQDIHHRILHLERREVRVAERLGAPHRLDREGARGVEVLLPADAEGAGVKRLGVRRRELGERQQHPHGDARPETRAHRVGDPARKPHAAAAAPHPAKTERAQLVGK